MKIKEVTKYLESIAPSVYQESYDNSGLIVGNPNDKVNGILICLDSIESIIDEAIKKGCNLVIAHHPIVFKGLKRFNGKNYVERTVIKAIKNDIAIYAIHTNLDNVSNGVNDQIAKKLKLIKTQILSPKKVVKKMQVFMPVHAIDDVKKALSKTEIIWGKDTIHSTYTTIGAAPYGKTNIPQVKFEIRFPSDTLPSILSVLRKELYEEDYTYDILDIQSSAEHIGSGMIGELKEETDTVEFLQFLKKTMKTGCVKHTSLVKKKVKKIAVCGGSGGFLLSKAIGKKADIFITSDYKYHEFFDADGQIIIADIGHYETEQFTIDLLYEFLKNKFSTFAVLKTKINTNPVNYL